MFKVIWGSLAVLFSLGVVAYAQSLPIPTEIYGTYAAHANCQQEPRVLITAKGAFIQSNGVQTGPLSVDVCQSCAGGVRYSGIERWLFILSGKSSPLTMRFNADEKPGHLEISKNEGASSPLTGPLASILNASPLDRCSVKPAYPVAQLNAPASQAKPSQSAEKSFAQMLSALMIPATMSSGSFYDWKALEANPYIQWQPLPPQMLEKPVMGGHYFKRNGFAKVGGAQTLNTFAAGARTMVMVVHFKNEGSPIGSNNLLSALSQSGFTVKKARCPIQPNPNVPHWYRLTYKGKQPALLWIIPASSNREHWEGFHLDLTNTLPPLTSAESSYYTDQCP